MSQQEIPIGPEQILQVHDQAIKAQATTMAEMHKNLNEVMDYLKKLSAPVAPAPVPVTPSPPPGAPAPDHSSLKRNDPKVALPPAFCGRDDKLGFVTWSFKLKQYFSHYRHLTEMEKVGFKGAPPQGRSLEHPTHP